jgi:hypothetical protein
MKVYICFASTGEFSDRSEWPVHGYRTEQEAQDFVTRSGELFREKWVQCGFHNGWGDYAARAELFAEGWHPDCPSLGEPDYAGFTFSYATVEIKDSTPMREEV